MNLNQCPDVLTIKDCQDILQVSRGTILKLIYEDELPAFRVGNRWRIRRETMMNFIEKHDY